MTLTFAPIPPEHIQLSKRAQDILEAINKRVEDEGTWAANSLVDELIEAQRRKTERNAFDRDQCLAINKFLGRFWRYTYLQTLPVYVDLVVDSFRYIATPWLKTKNGNYLRQLIKNTYDPSSRTSVVAKISQLGPNKWEIFTACPQHQMLLFAKAETLEDAFNKANNFSASNGVLFFEHFGKDTKACLHLALTKKIDNKVPTFDEMQALPDQPDLVKKEFFEDDTDCTINP